MTTETIEMGNVEITSWDIGAKEPPLLRHYFQGSKGLVFVIDASQRASFERAKDELQNISTLPDAARLPVLIIGNKGDVEGAANRLEIEDAIQIESLKQERKSVMCVSAMDPKTLKEPIRVMKSWV